IFDTSEPLIDNRAINEPSFFTQIEIDFFKQWAGQDYDKDNLHDKEAKTVLMDTVWNKTVYWSTQLISRLEGFETENPRKWNLRNRFKPYTWAKIYKKGQDEKDIFFTVGINSQDKTLV